MPFVQHAELHRAVHDRLRGVARSWKQLPLLSACPMYIASGPLVGVGVTDVIVTSTSPFLLQEYGLVERAAHRDDARKWLNLILRRVDDPAAARQQARPAHTAVKKRRKPMDGIVYCAA